MKQLDKFIKEITVLEYKLEDKIIKGDVSAYNLLKLQTLANKNLDESQQIIETFNIIFGEDNTKLLLNKLELEAIVEIVSDISKEFGNDIKDTKK